MSYYNYSSFGLICPSDTTIKFNIRHQCNLREHGRRVVEYRHFKANAALKENDTFHLSNRPFHMDGRLLRKFTISDVGWGKGGRGGGGGGMRKELGGDKHKTQEFDFRGQVTSIRNIFGY